MTERQVCPFHADDDVVGERMNDEGAYSFACDRAKGHPTDGPYRWTYVVEPAGLDDLSGIADELRLQIALPAAVATRPGHWLEYGVVEAAYAAANPEDFAFLVSRYSHTAVAEKKYTASAFLAAALGRLSRTGHVLFHPGPATGRWSYNSSISWWALAPEPDWNARISWAEVGLGMSYVPGGVE